MRTLAALSGGVDSSVAAALAVDAGDDVTGVHLALWGGAKHRKSCSTADTVAAQAAADTLGIDLISLDRRDLFNKTVVDTHRAGLENGIVTNPCTACNARFKLEDLHRYATEHGYDRIVTGHWVRNINGRLHRHPDIGRDQSYVLWQATPDQLTVMDFPLGAVTDKNEVRDLAHRFNLPAADTPDSQDLCFDRRTLFDDTRTSRITATDGTVLSDAGPDVRFVTIGQRRGLNVSGRTRLHVISTNPAEDTITVGDRRDLIVTSTPVTGVVGDVAGRDLWWQSSAHGALHPGTLEGDTIRWTVARERITPGQDVVAYNEDGGVVGGCFAAR